MAAIIMKTLGQGSPVSSDFQQVVRRLCLKRFDQNAMLKQSRKFSGTPSEEHEDNFRVYEIEGLHTKNDEKRRKRYNPPMPTPRFRSMPTDQDWTNVWPSAETFKWSAVPFPVRQGYINNTSENEGVIPSKYANLELMKIPNFLHLTPAHIKKHCAAIKKFCTPWPEELETDEQCRAHFPLEAETSDYVFAAPSAHDDRARVANIKFHLSDLDLDYHARDKFIRLVGHRYNPKTDLVTFESERCPLKTQNLEYVEFLLTATFFESWKREGWEDLKELSDMESYIWDINASRKTALGVLWKIKETDNESKNSEGKLDYLTSDRSDAEAICSLPEVQNYKKSVEELFNTGETQETLSDYKESVKAMLNLKSSSPLHSQTS